MLENPHGTGGLNPPHPRHSVLLGDFLLLKGFSVTAWDSWRGAGHLLCLDIPERCTREGETPNLSRHAFKEGSAVLPSCGDKLMPVCLVPPCF